MTDVDDVGVRELRQNLSVYLRRIAQGETLRVTEHGHPVALLTPIPQTSNDALDQLEAEGLLEHRAGPRTRPLPRPVPRTPGEPPISEQLIRDREEDWR
ncbi:MAG TPA: type II toxin-antitoxin system prevent-host-death family antitoxin [Mycobacteriales bacterium]|nr:type II toxin-antitoxin system prevent-host-death family antitoxin [Mycobacteriales bacterium]